MLQQNKHYISINRLQPYELICKQHGQFKYNPISVYTALQYRANIYFSLIQDIEVAVRNEMSEVLRQKAPNNDLLTFFQNLTAAKFPLSPESKKILQNVLNDLQKNKPNYDEHDVISHLTFGFWVHLINHDTKINPQYLYWQNIFNHQLFDNRFANLKDIFTKLRQVLSFRNKLFHQEAIWKGKNITTPQKALQNMEKKFKNFSNYLALVAPERAKLRQSIQLQLLFEQTIFNESVLISEIEKLDSLL